MRFQQPIQRRVSIVLFIVLFFGTPFIIYAAPGDLDLTFDAGTIDSRLARLSGDLPSTAASVIVSGRVVAPSGRGVSRARVYLTDPNGESQIVLTNLFGGYQFTDVATGETYILNAYSKRFVFAPQVISVTEEIAELNITAQP